MDKAYNYSGLVELVNKAGGNKAVSREVGFDVKKTIARGLNTKRLGVLCERFRVDIEGLVKYELGNFGDVVGLLDDIDSKKDKSLLMNRAVEEYKKGKSAYMVGKELGISNTTLKKWLVNAGIYRLCDKSGKATNKETKERNGLLLEEIKAGASVNEVAEKYSLSKSCIYTIMKKNNVEAKGLVRLYTDEQKERALEECLSGKYTAEQVAKRTGVGLSTVYNLKSGGLRKEHKNGAGRKTRLPTDEIVKLYKEGVGTRRLGNMYNTCDSNIRRCLVKLGVYEGVRNTPPRKNPKKDEVIALTNEGLSIKEICEKLQVSHAFVYTVLRETGKGIPKLRKPDIMKKEWEEMSVEADTYMKQKEVLTNMAEKYSLERRNIKAMLKKAGVEFKKREKVLPVEEVILAYKDGLNLNKLARKFHVSNSTAREILINNGVEIRTTSRGFVSDDIPEKVLQLSKDCMPKEIADKLGISLSSVYKIFRENKELS